MSGDFVKKLKSLDVYRDIPKDLTEQTVTGAAVSIFAALLMGYLFLAEFVAFLTPEISHEMFVDSAVSATTTSAQHMLQINMNISMPKIPCAVVSVDAQDVMGSHVVDVGGKLHKIRLGRDGLAKRGVNGQPAQVEGGPPEEQVGEGCNIAGTMIVKRVPGNFHVSAHAHAHLIGLFFQNDPMNVSHMVHNLWFGETSELGSIAQAEFNPLSGVEMSGSGDGVPPGEARSYEYYINIVPTQLEKLSGKVFNSFQYVANSNDVVGRYRIPAVYFRYELSAITVRFAEKHKSFAHFLVQICAIVGGVFTVLGLVSSVLHKSLTRFIKKANEGKLG